MLSLQKLEIFAAVVQHGSFTQAAKHLYMTQSAVSQHIQDLEVTLGAKLFTRGRRGVVLTASGETLHAYTQKILYLVAEAEGAVTNVSELVEGQTTIGATPTISVYLVPQWISKFRQQYTHLTVSLKTNVTSEIVNQVMNHQLDFAFAEGEIESAAPAALGVQVIDEIDLYVVVGKHHPFAEQRTIPIHALRDLAFVMRPPNSHTRQWMDGLLHHHQITPRISAEFDNPESIKQAVATGPCITILPDYSVREEEQHSRLSLLKVDGMNLTRTLKLVWDKQKPFPPIARAFLDFLEPEYPPIQSVLAP